MITKSLKKNDMKKFDVKKIKTFIFLHLVFLLYSAGTVLSKTASRQQIFSPVFIICYISVVLILIIYAVLWQQILKKLPLSVAFANKGALIIWGMVWGAIIFGETIKINMILGSVIVMVGIVLVVSNYE